MTNFFPAAQAVKDAAVDAYWLFHPAQVAAALRAAASQLTSAKASNKLRAIADELAGHA